MNLKMKSQKFEVDIYEWNISGTHFLGSVPFPSKQEAEIFVDCYNSKNVFTEMPKSYIFAKFKPETQCTKN